MGLSIRNHPRVRFLLAGSGVSRLQLAVAFMGTVGLGMRQWRSMVTPKSLETVIEEARLAVLHTYSVLAPQEIEGLSRLSQHTACSFAATHAAVSFVGEAKVWFGGAFGFSGTQTSRQYSFCDAVVRSQAPLLVPDGSADPRFWHHAMVRGEPGLRSYAGVPLIDPGGYTLGTVATYSTSPAAFAPAMLRDLSGLAGLVRDFLVESRLPPPIAPEPVVEQAPPPRVQGWLGVKTLQTDDGRQGRVAGLTVLSIAKGSPALLAGLRPTDILQSIGDRELFVSSDVASAMTGRVLGSRVQVRYRRAGQCYRCEIEIKARRTRFSVR